MPTLEQLSEEHEQLRKDYINARQNNRAQVLALYEQQAIAFFNNNGYQVSETNIAWVAVKGVPQQRITLGKTDEATTHFSCFTVIELTVSPIPSRTREYLIVVLETNEVSEADKFALRSRADVEAKFEEYNQALRREIEKETNKFDASNYVLQLVNRYTKNPIPYKEFTNMRDLLNFAIAIS
jgi:hypothetical protein